MSIWADIHRRSNGLQEKKEDKVLLEELRTQRMASKILEDANKIYQQSSMSYKDYSSHIFEDKEDYYDYYGLYKFRW